MGKTAYHDGVEVSALTRDTQALNLRIAGATYEQISEKLGYGGRSNARRAVRRRIEDLEAECEESAKESRRLELERLDALLLGSFPKARRGEPRAIGSVLAIMSRRASLIGLDAPTAAVQLTAENLSSDVRDQLLDRLARLTAAAEASEDPVEPVG